ncbi:MAG TPA: hypothetical protein VK797_10830, partial [Tepidisphaeraceae bacterium]|nr:hypothetical protein [Tepidisphaeraceae bacterium]
MASATKLQDKPTSDRPCAECKGLTPEQAVKLAKRRGFEIDWRDLWRWANVKCAPFADVLKSWYSPDHPNYAKRYCECEVRTLFSRGPFLSKGEFNGARRLVIFLPAAPPHAWKRNRTFWLSYTRIDRRWDGGGESYGFDLSDAARWEREGYRLPDGTLKKLTVLRAFFLGEQHRPRCYIRKSEAAFIKRLPELRKRKREAEQTEAAKPPAMPDRVKYASPRETCTDYGIRKSKRRKMIASGDLRYIWGRNPESSGPSMVQW